MCRFKPDLANILISVCATVKRVGSTSLQVYIRVLGDEGFVRRRVHWYQHLASKAKYARHYASFVKQSFHRSNAPLTPSHYNRLHLRGPCLLQQTQRFDMSPPCSLADVYFFSYSIQELRGGRYRTCIGQSQ